MEPAAVADIGGLADITLAGVRRDTPFSVLDDFVEELSRIREASDGEEWRDCQARLRQHDLFRTLHQAPLTQRAFDKPRGYPGDAVTMDVIYGLQPASPDWPATLRQLAAWEFQAPSCRSVRARKSLLAEQIDLAAGRVPRPRILSLACGHLREARESTLLLDRRAAEFIALDQDAASLALVDAELGAYGFSTHHGSVRGILARKTRWSGLDLIYSAGLYDYLPDPVAVTLTARLFDMLGVGGRLLIANFNPTLRDIAYLEAVMDWHLIYRSDLDMERLLVTVPDAELESARLFRDRLGNITFLEVTRR